MFKFDVYFKILKLTITFNYKKSINCVAGCGSYTTQFKHKNNQNASTDYAEWCLILHVSM